MNLSVRVQITIEMLDIFFSSKAPFDIIMSKFFKQRKWIGASDRRAIAEFSYEIFRNWEKLKFLTSRITSNFGRFFVISFMKIEKNMSLDEISGIFNGTKLSPTKLSDYEKKFIESIKPLSSELPQHIKLNYPEWMSRYIENIFQKDELEKAMLAMNSKAHLDIRVNLLKSTIDQVAKILNDSGFIATRTKYSNNCLRIINGRLGRGHKVLSEGLASIQDEGSQMIAMACQAQPGDTVIDYCAGAGGKTLALAASMNNKGRIFALDKYPERLENAKLRFRNANVNNVFCQEITGKWLKRHSECADIVLVDAPCSGTGTWRRNPDMRAKFNQNDLNELIKVQAEILENACKLVKQSGRMVYATCSILKEENEMQIENFLDKHSDFTLEPVNLNNYNGKFLRLYPHIHETDGFFAAIMTKK